MLRALLFGGTCDGDACDKTDDFERPARQVMRDVLRGGVTFPWTLWVSIAIGAALMSTRLLFGTEGAAADSDHIVGALIITMSIMAWAEVARALRYVNALFGAWLVVAPWILAGYSATAAAGLAGLATRGGARPAWRMGSRHYIRDNSIISIIQ
ncbi:MAG: SPW repeat protein [Pseudomonadota bacterium]